jgi:hypothetical protein
MVERDPSVSIAQSIAWPLSLSTPCSKRANGRGNPYATIVFRRNPPLQRHTVHAPSRSELPSAVLLFTSCVNSTCFAYFIKLHRADEPLDAFRTT